MTILLKKHYLTIDDFAELSGVSRQRISQYIKAGQISPEPVKFGKNYAIQVGSVINKKSGRGKGKKPFSDKKKTLK